MMQQGVEEVSTDLAGNPAPLLVQTWYQAVFLSRVPFQFHKMSFFVLFGLTLAGLVSSQARYNVGNSGGLNQPLGQPSSAAPAPVFLAGFNVPAFGGSSPGGPDVTPDTFRQPVQPAFGFAGTQNLIPDLSLQPANVPFSGPVMVINAPSSGARDPVLDTPVFLPSAGQQLGGQNNRGPISGPVTVINAPSSGPRDNVLGTPVFLPSAGQQLGDQNNRVIFDRQVVAQPVTPTVTQTSTIDSFVTVTDLVLNSVPVTETVFTLLTTTQLTRVVVPTPVNDFTSLATAVVSRPSVLTVTETSSNFRIVVRTSFSHVVLTHTSYAITNVPFTITEKQTVRVTSLMVRTVINTSVTRVTDYRTVAHTAFVHAGYA